MGKFLQGAVFFLLLFSVSLMILKENSNSSDNTKNTYNDEYEYFDNSVGYSYIDSYIRSDGTIVSGHYRTDPDEYEENNFSYEGAESSDWDYDYYE